MSITFSLPVFVLMLQQIVEAKKDLQSKGFVFDKMKGDAGAS